MNADSNPRRDGPPALSGYADFIALAVIALTLGVMGAGNSCTLETLFDPATRVEASGRATDSASAPRASTGWLCK